MMLIKLAKAVMKYAEEHYEESGWDEIVECWEVVEIGTEIKELGCKTEQEAIEAFKRIVDLRSERKREIEAEAF